jgi:anti-sigma factor RsiW
MNHDEAVQEMATERYLLDELSPELREAFEEHMFDCQECAFDVRAGNVFLTEAKVQLTAIVASEAVAQLRPEVNPKASPAPRQAKKSWWSFLTAPAFAVPAFAMLLAVIAFQNVSTIPSLRSAATEPRVLPWSSLHMGTRGAEPTVVQADRKQGAVILIDLPQQPAYTSYAVDLYDPQGKRIWTRTVTASQNDSGAGTLSLLIPGAGLEQGSYSLNLAGISPQGARTELGRRALDVHFNE